MSNYTLPTWVLDVVEKHGVPLWVKSSQFKDMYPLDIIERGNLIGSDLECSSLWLHNLSISSARTRVALPELDIASVLTEFDHALVFGTEVVKTPQWLFGKACLYISIEHEPLLLGILSNHEQYCITMVAAVGSIKTFEGTILHTVDDLKQYFRISHSKVIGSTLC